MEIADWWTKFQKVEHAERETMLMPDLDPKKRRRRSRKPRAAVAVTAAITRSRR